MGQENADRVQRPRRIVDGISPPSICSMSDLEKITLLYLYTKKLVDIRSYRDCICSPYMRRGLPNLPIADLYIAHLYGRCADPFGPLDV